MTDAEKKAYYDAYVDNWRLFLKYEFLTDGREDSESWEKLVEESRDINLKHGTKFCRRNNAFVLNYINDMSMERRGKK